MNVFELRHRVVDDYSSYVRSFIRVLDPTIAGAVDSELNGGILWPEPLIQLNPSFEPGEYIDQLVKEKLLEPECSQIFRRDKDKPDFKGVGRALRLHKHQVDAIRTAQAGHNYVLTTGTGSGK